MLNQAVLVGRVYEIINAKNNEVTITLEVKRVENQDNIDLIKFTLYKNLAKNFVEYCKKGDIIGVKGRLSTINDNLTIIVEKVTFLSKNVCNE